MPDIHQTKHYLLKQLQHVHSTEDAAADAYEAAAADLAGYEEVWYEGDAEKPSE
jgi:hypothetical protein